MLVTLRQSRNPATLECVQAFLKSIGSMQVHARVLDAQSRTAVAMGSPACLSGQPLYCDRLSKTPLAFTPM